MSTEKMREEFEVWVAESLLEGLVTAEKLVRLRDGDNYSVMSVNHNSARYTAGVLSGAWRAWQASRAALVIDLSPCNVQHASYNNVDCYAITDVAVILKRAGVKVKP